MSDDLDRWLTKAEAAQRVRVSPKTIQRWVASGKLRAHREGHKILRIKARDLDAVLEDAA